MRSAPRACRSRLPALAAIPGGPGGRPSSVQLPGSAGGLLPPLTWLEHWPARNPSRPSLLALPLGAQPACLPSPPWRVWCAEGVKAEEAFEKDGSKPDPASTDNPEFQIVLRIIRDGLEKDPKK